MTKQELIQRVTDLTDEQYASVAPLFEADLEAASEIASLHLEVVRGRLSATNSPLLDAKEVYARVRASLAE